MLLALGSVHVTRNSSDLAEIMLRQQVKGAQKTYQIQKLFKLVSH